MSKLFFEGGALFMSVLTLELVIIFVVFAASLRIKEEAMMNNRINLMKSIGALALVTGILGQLLGLYAAFEAISQMGTVSPQMLAGGLRVSSITSIYGLIIFCVCYLLSFGMSYLNGSGRLAG